MKSCTLFCLLACFVVTKVRGQAQLLNDINPTVIANTGIVSPGTLVEFSDKLYYRKSGRVAIGVTYEANVVSNQSRYLLDKTMLYGRDLSGHLYFYGAGVSPYANLYKLSAGTSGPELIMDSVTLVPTEELAALGNKVFFSSYKDSVTSLWATNGTNAGTSLIIKFTVSGERNAVRNIETVNGEVFFTVGDSLGNAIWKTDGTTGGTVRISSLNVPASRGGRGSASLNNIYFAITGGQTGGHELWRSDGTASGTWSIRKIANLDQYTGNDLVALGTKIFFNVADGADKGLWVTDGSLNNTIRLDTGTVHLRAAVSNGSIYYDSWGIIGSKLVYASQNSTSGRELWITDGTVPGTHIIADINPGTPNSYSKILNTINNEVYFVASDLANGSEIWKTDGTAAGTKMWLDLSPGTTNSAINSKLFQLNNKFYFVQDSTLMESDGTIGGTSAVNFPAITLGSSGYVYPVPGFYSYAGFTVWNGSAYFGAFDEQIMGYGNTLWKTDGTPGGTQKLVPDLFSHKSTQVFVRPTFAAGSGYLAFAGVDSLLGAELWKTDGTPAGTVMIKDILPGSSSSRPVSLFTASDNNIYFGADTVGGHALFRTDGTSSGTISLNIIGSETIRSITELNSHVVYFTKDNVYSYDMTGGISHSIASNLNLQKVRHDFESDSVSLYAIVGNYMLFVVTGSNQSHLWRTDGTASGTSFLTTFPTWAQSIVSMGGEAYIGVGYAGYTALWKSDGTTSGTVPLKFFDWDVNHYSQPRNLKVFNNRVYFSANTHTQGVELWSSDGTASGTTIVKDIFPGYRSSVPREFIDVPNGKFMFVADDGVFGQELWITDGTDTGTHNYAQTMFGCASLSPHFLNYVNGHAVFYGAHDMYGYEPFSINPFQVVSVEQIETRKITKGLHVYPNPARDVLTISVENGQTYSLFNINGANLMSGNIQPGVATLRLNIGSLAPGMYFIQVTDKTGKRDFAKWLKE